MPRQAPVPMLRLDRLLSNLGYGTRGEVRLLIQGGRVRVAGVTATDEGAKVGAASVLVDGEGLDHPDALLIALHKPTGYSCSHDEREAPLVYELLPQRWRRRNPAVEAVGRLDRETSGLLLMTDDHQLLHRLTSPKHHVPKTYVAVLDREPPFDIARMFAAGTLLLDRDPKPCLPAIVESVCGHTVTVVLTEGRYHQVRRMFAAIGCTVEKLHRSHVGDEHVDGLEPGEFRVLEGLRQSR